VGRLPTKKTITSLVSDLANPQILYASSGDGVFKSTDAGVSWQTMNNGLPDTRIVSVTIHPTKASRLYAVAASGQVFRSIDGAANWQLQGQLPTK
jgi:photosystem II stability/assembly factor-like uncharacterized protein